MSVVSKSFLIDIHCHILPGMDDGPHLLEISLDMAKIALKDRIKTIIATPHTDGIRVNRDSVRVSVDRLNSELSRENIHLEILSGYEIPYHLVSELAVTHTLASSNYVLVEFPHNFIPVDALVTCYQLLDKGFQPIIAHPERNMRILQEPDTLEELLGSGAQAQLTAASITGALGPDIQQCAQWLLHKEFVHFIATDSHSPTFREPILSKAYKKVTKLIGKEKADTIFFHNPSKITEPNNTTGSLRQIH